MATVIKNIPFIGGTAQTYKFDFFTKVANSVLECPMKIYGQDVDLANLPNPSTGWTENTTQSDLDMLKSIDGIALSKSTSIAGKARAMLIEVDATAITRDVYGNSNANMKSNFKTTSSIDIYATGSGANAGATAYSCVSKIWNNSTSAWDGLGSNTNTTIQKTTRTISSSNYISSSNKIYILITSGYASDGTIASTVNLDYINVRVDFNRVPDVVSPIPINLTNTWSFFIKGVKPNWANNINVDKYILTLFKDNYNMLTLRLAATTSKFRLAVSKDNVWQTGLWSATQNFNNFTSYNFLISKNSNNDFTMYLLKNNGSVEKVSSNNPNNLIGSVSIRLDGDVFIDSIYYLPNYVPSSDQEAKDILRGNKAGFENAELLYSSDFSDASKWTLNNGATISNNTLTLPNYNSTADQDVNVFPNNQYEVTLQKQGNMGVVEAKEYYNNIYIRSTMLGAGLNTFTTSPYTNKTKILLKNQLEGFTRNSVAYLSDGTQVANNVPRLEAGAFGGSDKAIMIEEGTTNYILNPSMESNLNNIQLSLPSNPRLSISQTTEEKYHGNSCLKITKLITESTPDGTYYYGVDFLNNFGSVSGATMTFSFYVKAPKPNVKVGMKLSRAGGDWQTFINFVTIPTTDWTRISISGTFNTSSSIRCSCRVFIPYDCNLNDGESIYVDAVQLEDKPYATSFVDGTRADEIFKIPTAGILNQNEGTIEMIIKLNDDSEWSSTREYGLFASRLVGGSNGFYCYKHSGKFIRFQAYNNGKILIDAQTSPVSSFTGHKRLAFTWNKNSGAKVFADGVKIGEAVGGFLPISKHDCPLFIGSLANYMIISNSLISDLRISNIARSDAEIAQAYASNAPLPIDQYTTYKLDFDSMNNAVISNVSMKLKM